MWFWGRSHVVGVVDSDGDGVSDRIERAVPLFDEDDSWVPAVYPPIVVLVASIALALWRRREF